MQAKSERFEMRLDLGTLEDVDSWRLEQDDLPNRSEAIRRLLDAGIAHSQGQRFTMSGTEKLILLMLCEVHKSLDVKSEFDPELIQAALYGGHGWGLEWKYGSIFRDSEDDKRTVDEVDEILKMWSAIERSYAALSDEEKAKIKEEAHPFGDDVEYPGFDGNHESEHLGIAAFFIKRLERFPEFAERAHLNSHSESLTSHRRMLAKFTANRKAMKRGMLSANQLVEILRARRWNSES